MSYLLSTAIAVMVLEVLLSNMGRMLPCPMHSLMYSLQVKAVSIILRCVIVKTVKLVKLIEVRKTDSFGETGLVLHIPSSS